MPDITLSQQAALLKNVLQQARSQAQIKEQSAAEILIEEDLINALK